MKQKTLGVIGGLGPETGCMFCLSVNNKFKPITKRQPHIILDNLPISEEAEERLINGGPSKEHLELLLASIERLNKVEVTLIAIACNTVHIFIDEARKHSSVPVLSIIEETAKKIKEMNIKKVGILASTKTIKSRLHENELKKQNIELVLPEEKEQQFLSECIVRIVNSRSSEEDKTKLRKIIKKLEEKGVQGIILGCTDLPLIISKEDAITPIINTTAILEDAAVNKLLNT